MLTETALEMVSGVKANGMIEKQIGLDLRRPKSETNCKTQIKASYRADEIEEEKLQKFPIDFLRNSPLAKLSGTFLWLK